MIKQIDSLLADYKQAVTTAKNPDLSDRKHETYVLINRFQAAIDRLTPPTSAYARQSAHVLDNPAHFRLPHLVGILTALREDMAAGWVQSVVELAHADTHSDYMEMAQDLLGKGYKDAAAVIAGSSLEVHLRALCVKYGVGVETNGKPKKADVMNADLKKADIYNGIQQKQITSLLATRNSAAHGQYGDYDVVTVRHLIDGVQAFMLKFPA
jgi:hypothetical protein